ncbi:hypothetical protein HSBAA_51400 [Vreelandella sulfidaeris]|uniref:Uncharacterized protein n=1 Tax=Vreelandella sulfidaeris TaxID=115553 RepID=A0A455ULL5_9GAMM|nr:hypothetical protein HSBAA_51400 [Halomonas sulfidaeris]
MFDVARIDQVGQEHLTLWNYMNDPLIFAVNQQVWQTLDEEQQAMLRETAQEAGEWEIAMTREEERTPSGDSRARCDGDRTIR